MKRKTLLVVVSVVVVLAGVNAAAAQGTKAQSLESLLTTTLTGTGFIYQRKLKSSSAIG